MIFEILIRHVLKTIIPSRSLIKYWMTVLEMKSSPLWMDSSDITKSRSSPKINTKQLSSALGAPSPTGKCPSASKMLELLSSGPCLMLSMISLDLWKLILMILLPTSRRGLTILLTLGLFLTAVGSTK